MSYNYPSMGQFGPQTILGATGIPAVSTAVTVNVHGGGAASLYTDYTGVTGAANPVTTDAYGNLIFFATPGMYDLVATIGGVSTTISNIEVLPWWSDLYTPGLLHPNIELPLAFVGVPANSNVTLGGGSLTIDATGWYQINLINVVTGAVFTPGGTANPYCIIYVNGIPAFAPMATNGLLVFCRAVHFNSGDVITLKGFNPAAAAGTIYFSAPEAVTTIAAGSNGVSLPTATIDVASSTAFVVGTDLVQTAIVHTTTGMSLVYFGGTATGQLTVCSGGTGVMSTGNAVGTGTSSIFQVTFLHG